MIKSLTYTLLSCGEETEQDCLKSFFAEDTAGSVYQEVRNIYPAAEALNTMIRRCETTYLVPLDADFVLYPGFHDRIRRAVEDVEGDPTWHSILFPLWDTLTQEKIMALKVFRTSIVKEIQYFDDACPDIQHYKDLTFAGYKAINLMDQEPIGDHVVRGPHFCYAKYRDLYNVHRCHPKSILESHFKGGGNMMRRAARHHYFFMTRYDETQNEDYLYCIAGMVDGISSPLDRGSKNLGNREMRVGIEEAKQTCEDWFWNSGKIKKTML